MAEEIAGKIFSTPEEAGRAMVAATRRLARYQRKWARRLARVPSPTRSAMSSVPVAPAKRRWKLRRDMFAFATIWPTVTEWASDS